MNATLNTSGITSLRKEQLNSSVKNAAMTSTSALSDAVDGGSGAQLLSGSAWIAATTSHIKQNFCGNCFVITPRHTLRREEKLIKSVVRLIFTVYSVSCKAQLILNERQWHSPYPAACNINFLTLSRQCLRYVLCEITICIIMYISLLYCTTF